MNKYTIEINNGKDQYTCTLLHTKSFNSEELNKMVSQAVSELKWSGIKRTYSNEKNYLLDHFGFIQLA